MGNEEEEDVWGWLNKPIAAPADSGAIPQGRPDMPVITPKQQGFISSTVAPLAATKALDKASTVGYDKLAGLFGSAAPAMTNYTAGTGALAAAAPEVTLAAPALAEGLAAGGVGNAIAGSTAAGALAAPAAAAVGGEAAAAPMLAAMGPLGWAALGIMGTRALGLWS